MGLLNQIILIIAVLAASMLLVKLCEGADRGHLIRSPFDVVWIEDRVHGVICYFHPNPTAREGIACVKLEEPCKEDH